MIFIHWFLSNFTSLRTRRRNICALQHKLLVCDYSLRNINCERDFITWKIFFSSWEPKASYPFIAVTINFSKNTVILDIESLNQHKLCELVWYFNLLSFNVAMFLTAGLRKKNRKIQHSEKSGNCHICYPLKFSFSPWCWPKNSSSYEDPVSRHLGCLYVSHSVTWVYWTAD